MGNFFHCIYSCKCISCRSCKLRHLILIHHFKMFNSSWFQILLFLLLAGLVKGGLHMVKIVILAGLGLAGMWMLHTLAQDYNKISNRFMGISTPAKSAISKRSSDGTVPETDIPGFPELKWESVLSQDPEGCVPNFICQLAAIPDENLLPNERNVLKLIRATSEKNTKANKIVRQALRLGERIYASQCYKYYSSCPYTRQTMLSIMQTYGGR